MYDDHSHPALPSKDKFDIDHEQLGIFLAEALIRRVGVFDPSQRVRLLRACRIRLAQEGGEFLAHLLQNS